MIIVIILIIKYNQKLTLDKNELQQFLHDIKRLKAQKSNLQKDIEAQNSIIEEYNNKIINIRQKYDKANRDLTNYFEQERKTRQEQLDENLQQLREEKEKNLQSELTQYRLKLNETQKLYEDSLDSIVNEYNARALQIQKDIEYQEERFNKLLAPLQQYEKDKQAKLFYTIQVPDEYKEDIDFLLTSVASKIQHPDVINKLIWTEYVKPYIDDTFKRVGIESNSGIYKLTNIDSGKSYIGKSTDIKKRISDHFRGAIGIDRIADQAVHHAIRETGFWNWSIECITYCDKDKLNELEKYYIEFFKTQSFGYNKNIGGGG